MTLWVWPLPARAATRWCSRRGITPNAVTVVSYLLTLLVVALWLLGFFAAGLVLAWAMTFLDTVDGKLARVTHASSRTGHVLDHGLDLVHPPIWWAAWAWGLAAGEPGFGDHAAALWIVVGGYLAGRLLEGLFIVVFKNETRCSQTLEPPVVIRPSRSMMSFSAIGTPWKGPTAWPVRIAFPAASAASRASSA